MPPRRPKRQCGCEICNGNLVDENTWRSHQVPKQSRSSVQPASLPFDEQSPDKELSPDVKIFIDEIPETTTIRTEGESSKTARREEKEKEKEENNRYTKQAAARISGFFSRSQEILTMLP